MPNPYDPQTPVNPHYFGGRKPMICAFKERIEEAIENERSGGVLIYGHRGVGKTSLLRKFIDIVQNEQGEKPSNILIVHRRLSRTTNSDELYNVLIEELNAQLRERRTLVEKLRDAGKSLSGVNAFGIRIDIQKEKQHLSPYQLWKLALKSLDGVSCVLVAIDDADELEISALGELKTVMEELTGLPLLLVVSGGVEFEERLVGKYSPIARIFSGASFNISRFKLEETRDALNLPIEEEETNWSDPASEAIHILTLGYPYLVQCLAKASYKKNREIEDQDVIDNITNAVETGRAWLGHEIPDASDNDIRAFLKIVELSKEVFTSKEMKDKGVKSTYIGRLVTLGVLEKISYGRYKLEKSPIVAIFEKLKRGLK